MAKSKIMTGATVAEYPSGKKLAGVKVTVRVQGNGFANPFWQGVRVTTADGRFAIDDPDDPTAQEASRQQQGNAPGYTPCYLTFQKTGYGTFTIDTAVRWMESFGVMGLDYVATFYRDQDIFFMDKD